MDRSELNGLSDQKAASIALQPGSDSPATAPSASIPPSTPRVQPPSVPDYELIERIGSGAYGEVWRARSAATGVLRTSAVVAEKKVVLTGGSRIGDEHVGITVVVVVAPRASSGDAPELTNGPEVIGVKVQLALLW